MRYNAYQNYLDNEILGADHLKLVVLLYRGALDAIGMARQHLAAGDILARSNSITKAMQILVELHSALDMNQGAISAELAKLYDYVHRLLIDAHTRQIERPLIEAEGLLNTLLEAWTAIQSEQQVAPVQAESYSAAAGYGDSTQYTESYQRVSYAY